MNKRRAIVTLLITVGIAWGSLATMLAIGWAPKLGLDLQGGFAVTLVAPEGTEASTLDTAAEIMRRRIENLGGVQEPEIAVVGDRAIVVQLPGVTDRDRALQAVGTTGELSFRPVNGEYLTSPAIEDPDGDHPDGLDPVTGVTLVDDVTMRAYLYDQNEIFVYDVNGAFLTGADITDAQVQFSQSGVSGQWVVVPEFTAEGGEKFREATKVLASYPPGDPRRQLAIVVDGVVFSAPAVAEDVNPAEGLDPNSVVITVGTSGEAQQEAEDLAAILRYGALPTTFERERFESVSATLGEESLKAGLIAGLVGLLLVAGYMLIYYRSLGIVSFIGLTVFGSLLISVIILLGETQGTTLTLAGVTGVIVSIGITLDSYIVYFERIKEEYRKGRGLRPSISHAFESAYRTILTGDTVTLLGAVLLYMLAIGQVKGFALTLGIATVIDIFVAYFYTRPMTYLVGRGPLGDGGVFSVKGAMGKGDIEPSDVELVEVDA
ncbi:MAG: protein translocase subunit SecD [Armatimonadetes bacterium]|nr:MAG: protein translocase subunit SecD [Armatimonadota bacterium]